MSREGKGSLTTLYRARGRSGRSVSFGQFRSKARLNCLLFLVAVLLVVEGTVSVATGHFQDWRRERSIH